jgi:hypothetical protein
MTAGKIIICVLAGAAAGATLGVLMDNHHSRDSISVKKNLLNKKDQYSEAVKEKVVNFLFSLIDKITAEKQTAK